MNNQINSGVGFGAQLRLNFPVEDMASVKNVQEKFAKLTEKKYPNVTMYLSKLKSEGENDEFIVTHLSTKKSIQVSKDEVYYEGSNIVTSNWNRLKERFSDTEIAKFFARRLDIMKLEDKYEAKREVLRTQIVSLRDKYQANLMHAKVLRKLGNNGFAKRHEVVAEHNYQRLQELKKQMKAIDETYERQYTNIARNDADLMEALIV